MQTSLLRHFDKEYAFWSIIGFKKKKEDIKNQGVIKAQIDDMEMQEECNNINKKELFPYDIDYEKSLHCYQRQNSMYVKIDDNLLNCHFGDRTH